MKAELAQVDFIMGAEIVVLESTLANHFRVKHGITIASGVANPTLG